MVGWSAVTGKGMLPKGKETITFIPFGAACRSDFNSIPMGHLSVGPFPQLKIVIHDTRTVVEQAKEVED
jgi:hypothetical protein